jgi:hypothetical protein
MVKMTDGISRRTSCNFGKSPLNNNAEQRIGEPVSYSDELPPMLSTEAWRWHHLLAAEGCAHRKELARASALQIVE